MSVKIDAADSEVWKRIDRPHGSLGPEEVLAGAVAFARRFNGELVTETMLIGGVNDGAAHVGEVAERVKALRPAKAYILVPTRPPAETGVTRPSAEAIRSAYDIFCQSGLDTECITGEEDDSFYFGSDVADDLLRISSVHPVREDVIMDLLEKRGMDASVIEQLVEKKLICSYIYEGKRFYKRNLQ